MERGFGFTTSGERRRRAAAMAIAIATVLLAGGPVWAADDDGGGPEVLDLAVDSDGGASTPPEVEPTPEDRDPAPTGDTQEEGAAWWSSLGVWTALTTLLGGGIYLIGLATTEQERASARNRLLRRSNLVPEASAAMSAAATREERVMHLDEAWEQRVSAAELVQLAGEGRLRGGPWVELDFDLTIEILPDLEAVITYRHRLLNVGRDAAATIARELWFEHPDRAYELEASSDGDRRVTIRERERLDQLYRFSCTLSPSVAPGEVAELTYVARPGKVFRNSHYWKQSVPRFVHAFRLRLIECSGRTLTSWDVSEVLADGTSRSIEPATNCTVTDDEITIEVDRTMLRPGQEIGLKWDLT